MRMIQLQIRYEKQTLDPICWSGDELVSLRFVLDQISKLVDLPISRMKLLVAGSVLWRGLDSEADRLDVDLFSHFLEPILKKRLKEGDSLGDSVNLSCILIAIPVPESPKKRGRRRQLAEQAVVGESSSSSTTVAQPVPSPSDHLAARYEETVARYSKKPIQILRDLDLSKKLLILDLDYTLFNHKNTVGDASLDDLTRPGLHEFMGDMFQHYNIGIWSQTSKSFLEIKLQQLGLFNNRLESDYCVNFVVDTRSMFPIETRKHGAPYQHHVKALGVLWKNVEFSGFGPHNTIHVDDITRNFALNPRNGIKIKAFRTIDPTDSELLYLGRYLLYLAQDVDDLTTVDHADWKKWAEKKLRRRGRGRGRRS